MGGIKKAERKKRKIFLEITKTVVQDSKCIIYSTLDYGHLGKILKAKEL